MANLFGLDTDALIAEHYPQLLAELESWEEMTSSDETGDGSKRKDVRTIVRESAERFATSESHTSEVSEVREIVGQMINALLSDAGDDAESVSFVTSVLADAAGTLNERAKYLHKQSEPEATDVDEDMAQLHALMSERRDGLNSLLRSGDYVPDEGTEVVKGKRVKATVTVGDVEVPVNIGKDSKGNTILTVDHRLPNAPGTSTPGRKVHSSNLTFTVNGETFVPTPAVAAQHLAWKINSLGGNVPIGEEAFITHVQSLTETDYFGNWTAYFDNDVTVTCVKR